MTTECRSSLRPAWSFLTIGTPHSSSASNITPYVDLMKILGHPFSLLLFAASAGMAAQELVTGKLMAASDQAEVVSAESLARWGTAEAYYAEGRLPHEAFTGAETSMPIVGRTLGITPQNGSLQGAPVAAKMLALGQETRPPIITRSQTSVLAQSPTRPPASGAKPPMAAPEPDGSTVDVLPPPSKRVPTDNLDEDEPGRADYSRTPADVAPLPSYPITPPVWTGNPPSDSRRRLDAQDLVRRRAAQKAEERRRRIEVRKWLGYSPLRPSVGAVPFMGGDSPRPTFILVPYAVDDGK